MPFMKTLLTIALTVCFNYLFGQNSEDNRYYLPTSVFKSEIYKAERHPKFDGEIKKVGNKVSSGKLPQKQYGLKVDKSEYI
jgi:hypothetical protein